MKRTTHLLLVLFALVAISSLAQAQVILVTSNTLNFNAAPGSSSAVQQFTISTTGAPTPFSLSFTPLSGGRWLTLGQVSGTLPATVLVAANAATLAPGIYTGNLSITATGVNNSPLIIPVTFSVGVVGGATISAAPSSLTFSAQVGGPNPLPQGLILNTAVTAVNFIATPSVVTGTGWLAVSPPSGTAPAALNVSVNATGLTAGTYYGSININPSTGPAVVVPVTLQIGGVSNVNVSNSSLQFNYQTNGSYPPPQNINFTSDGAGVNFTLTPTTSSGGNWLSVTPLIANTPRTVTVSVSPNGLAPGTYTGTIAIASTNAVVTTQAVTVTLTVGTTPLLTLGTAPAPFNYQTGGAVPASQSLTIGSTGGPLSYGVTAATTAGNWLSVGPQTGITPATLTVGVNPAGLGPGSYSGIVTVTASGAANSPQTFTVTLNINSTATLAVTPASLNFSYQINGSNPVSQSVSVTTGAAAATLSVSAVTSGCGNWLQFYPSAVTAPGTLTVSVATAGLNTPQICSGTVTLRNDATLAQVQIPVTLNVSNTPLLVVNPIALTFNLPYNSGISDPQTISLTATNGGAITFNASTTYDTGGSWLQAGPTAGSTPNTISVFVNPYGLVPGTYTGYVTLVSPGLPAVLKIPVTLNVTPVTMAAVSPSALTFIQAAGGNAPPPQTVSVTSQSGSLPFTATPATANGLGWLKVSQATGTTPGTISIAAVATGLPAGVYNGSVSISMAGASNSPLLIPVTLTVAQSQNIAAAPTSLNFNYQIGSTIGPADQAINVSSTGGIVSFNAGATAASGGNWLRVTPLISATPSALAVSVNPSNLAAGTYTGQISILAQGVSGSPISIPVTLTVQSATTPVINQLMNAASSARGSVAPGEIVTIKGIGLGPTDPAVYKLNSAGRIDTFLAGTRVLFDGFEAPILYTSPGQINLVAPYEIGDRQVAQVQVEFQGVRSAALAVSVVGASPGIFTTDSSGVGQGAILNQDSTVNSAQNPAARGSVVQVFATGEGQTTPPGVTGGVSSGTLPSPVLGVTATINGQPAEVLYAGAAPNSISGLFQVNLRIPADAPARQDVLVTITVGGTGSQGGVTLAIR